MTARLLTDVGTMGETLEDLRDVAAAEAGRLRLEFRDVDVGEVVTRIVISYADLAARKGIVLDPGSAESIVARTDERRLTRIVTNLLFNALQATPPDGRVAVWVGRRPAAVTVDVEDGAGAGAAIRSALGGNGSGLGCASWPSLAKRWAPNSPSKTPLLARSWNCGCHINRKQTSPP
jgi:signal transduction histidine kinase